MHWPGQREAKGNCCCVRQTDSNWPTTLITGLWKTGNRAGICLNRKGGRSSSNQPARVLHPTCLSTTAVTDQPLQELTLAQVKPEPIQPSCTPLSACSYGNWRLFPVSPCPPVISISSSTSTLFFFFCFLHQLPSLDSILCIDSGTRRRVGGNQGRQNGMCWWSSRRTFQGLSSSTADRRPAFESSSQEVCLSVIKLSVCSGVSIGIRLREDRDEKRGQGALKPVATRKKQKAGWVMGNQRTEKSMKKEEKNSGGAGQRARS